MSLNCCSEGFTWLKWTRQQQSNFSWSKHGKLIMNESSSEWINQTLNGWICIT